MYWLTFLQQSHKIGAHWSRIHNVLNKYGTTNISRMGYFGTLFNKIKIMISMLIFWIMHSKKRLKPKWRFRITFIILNDFECNHNNTPVTKKWNWEKKSFQSCVAFTWIGLVVNKHASSHVIADVKRIPFYHSKMLSSWDKSS